MVSDAGGREPHMPLPWEQAGWLAEASQWIEAQVRAHGWQGTAPIEVVHQRPWSAFLRMETDHGSVYFKAPAPSYGYEAPLTEALGRWAPEVTVPLLATDLERGWILSTEAGVTLRALVRNVEQIEHWVRLLPHYGEFGIKMAGRVPELLALGMPDRRLSRFPDLYAELLEDRESLMIGQELGLSPGEHEQLQGWKPRVEALCEELAALGLPETLVHEELHENNVLFGDGRYVYTDWSDSSVGHPFFAWVVTRRSIAHWLKLDETGPDLQRVQDAFLEPWTRFAPRAHLASALDVAFRLGMINRSLSWHQAMARLAPEHRINYADNVPGWLQDFIQEGIRY